MHRFLTSLSSLLRTGDTRALELVVGMLSSVLGTQLLAILIGVLPSSAVTHVMPGLVVWLLVVLFIVGGVTKIIGAILDLPVLRIASALSLSGVWLYLFIISVQIGTIFSTLLYLIFALQSAWIYIRLSILRKQRLS